jgi:hypothetical protein
MAMIRGLVNRFRCALTSRETDGVVEPDPRIVMAVLAVGMIVGTLMTTQSDPTPFPTVSAAIVAVDR